MSHVSLFHHATLECCGIFLCQSSNRPSIFHNAAFACHGVAPCQTLNCIDGSLHTLNILAQAPPRTVTFMSIPARLLTVFAAVGHCTTTSTPLRVLTTACVTAHSTEVLPTPDLFCPLLHMLPLACSQIRAYLGFTLPLSTHGCEVHDNHRLR